MNKKSKPTAKFIKGAISLVLISATSTSSFAEQMTVTKEQCAGVVRAGLNDCASQEHSCAGLNTDDGYDNDWVWMPKGTCDKITNGHVIQTVKKDS